MLLKIFLSLAGIGLMYYEKVVDENMTAAELARQEYKASCDMKVDFGFAQQEFSCSTILKSDYAVGFGFLQKVNIYYLPETYNTGENDIRENPKSLIVTDHWF